MFSFLKRDSGDKVAQSRLDEFVGGVDANESAPKAQAEKTPSKLTKNIDKAIEKKGFTKNIQIMLSQADLQITPTEYLMLVFISVVGIAALSFFIYRNIVLSLAGGVFGFFLPRIMVGRRKSQRLKMFNDQLGDTITLLANGLRSGYSIVQAMESVGSEMPDPIAAEFQRLVREIQLGVSSEQAMNNMARRIPSEDLELMVTAINVQSEVGGNLSEILEIIGFVIRERVRIQGEIKTLTAQGMMSGWVISLLPIILGLVLFAMNQEYIGRMVFSCPPPGGPIDCPTQPCGWIMLGTALFIVVLGFIAIQKIVKIEV